MDTGQSGLSLLFGFCLMFGACVAIPEVLFIASDQTVDEGDSVPIKLFRTETAGTLDVTITYTDVTTTSADYTAVTQVTFAITDKFVTFSIDINNEQVPERDETFNVSIASSNAYTVDGNPLTVTIRRNDQLTFKLETATAAEGTSPLTVTISTTEPVSQSYTVAFTIGNEGGTATSGTDYTPPATLSVTFDAGDSSQTFDIGITDDSVYEGQENFVISLTASEDYLTGPDIIYSIFDNDLPVFEMKVSAVSVNEDAGSVIITVKRDPVDGIMPAVTVLVQTTDKEAVAGSDFVVDGTPLTAVFAQGETEATVNISITDDDREEIAETFDVEIKTDAAYTIGSTPNTTVTINSDDLSTVSIKNEPNAVLESDAGARFVFLRELPAGGSDTALDLTLTITDGTAVAGDDYMQADPGVSFTFPIPSVGDTYSQMEFEIPMMFDDLYEPEETFTVAVPNQPTKYKLGWSNSAIVTITDDDEPMFKFSPATLTLNEGAGGTGSIVMVNHADNSPDYTVDILTKDGTALSASDYTSITSSITFTSASDTMTFPISTGADQTDEPSETFTVEFSSNVMTGSDGKLTVTITDDDDSVVSWDSNNMTKMEGEAAASLTLTRTNVENNAPALSFDLTSSGTVTSGDYTVQSLTVTFAAGSSQATYSVTINDDNVHEPSETLVLTLPASSAGMQSMGMKTFTLTIQDNDKSKITFEPDASVVEGNSVTLTLTREDTESNTPTVSLNLSPGGTASASDYTLSRTYVTFSQGDSTQAVILETNDDNIDEQDETVTVQFTESATVMQGTKGSQIITITDNDLSEVRFKGAGTMTIAENSASNNITVERTNSDSTSPEVNVTLSKTPDGTSDADFNIAAGPIQIVIAEGAAEATFDLAVIDDAIDEPNENLDLTIDASSTISTASPATLTVTITDDDKSIIEFENATMTVDEGDGTITISLKRTNAESNSPSVTVTLSAADDTATDGSDYSKNSLADVTFATGVDTASATISILQDTIDEADETFTITIAPTTTVQRGTNSDITITITDDDPSKVRFKNPVTLTAGEDSGSNNITVERMDNNANSPAVTVTLTKNHVHTIDADFTFGTDPIEIIIPAGQAEGTYNLVINDDEIHEPDENFELSIASSQTVTPVSPSTHTTTITDNDKSKVEFDASSSTVGEGDSTITIQLSRTNIESNSPSVSFTVTNTDQTATSPDDYDATSITSANFAAGQSSTNFTIDISEDIFDEKDETFELNIPTTATVEPEARGTIQITITDNDKSIFEFDQATSSVNEVDQSIDILVRRANINGNAPGGSLTFSLTPGTAVADDYSLTTATVNFGENEATAIVPVDVTDDARDEPDETFNITFTTDANIAAGTQSSSEITIIDDDKSTFAFDAATYSGKEDETVTVTVVRTDTMTGTTSVDVQFEAQYSNGEAVDADIVSAVPQILTFDSGITTQTFEITFNDDGIVEKDEVYNYTIKSSSVYDIAAQSSTTITIQDNDVSQVKFSQSESTIGEADGTVSITVDRTNAEANSPSVTVDLEFGAAGLATKGVDYTEPTPFQVTFAEGESTANVNISITDDDIDEPEEMFLVAFGTNPSLYNEHTFTTIGVKITDDDISYFEFASNTYSTDEDQNVTITINRKSPVGTVSVIVNLALAHVTTTAADVVSFPSTVTFPAGSASQQFTVNIMDDTEDEANETFTFVISEVANVYNIVPGGVGTTTVTIVDNDVPTISLENPRPTYESTGPLVVTATRTNGLIGQITVGLTVTDGTAVAGQDYVAPSPAQIVFEDGEASKSIDIEFRDDINREPTESFVIAIVDDAASFNTGTPNQVTANILDDDGPATYDCRRPGQQSCANNAQCIDGVCDCGSLSPQRAGYKCDYLKANVDQSPCTLSTCTEFGTCVNDTGTAKCYCDAGYEDPDTCTTARYQVICGENDMSIQIKPIGNFVGKVYAHQKEDTCTFDDKVNQQGMPSSFTGGKAKIIPNEDTACGNTQSIVMDNILRVSRLIYVQYNVDFQAVYDEFVRARCTFDLTKNVTLESVISPVTVRQGDVVQATAHGDLNPLDLGVTKDGSAITDSIPINMGELLIVRLSVSPATQFGALLVVDVTVDNNMAGNDLISIEIVKDSCYRDVAGIMSPQSTLMVTSQNGALQIQFEFRPPKFKNSDDVRIRVVAKLCPTSDTSACTLPTCTNKRRKRSTDKFGDKTVDVVFKVSDAQSDKKLTDLGPYIRPGSFDSSQAITCENQVGTGVIAAIGMMAVLLLLFLVLTIVLFFRLMRRPAHTKAEDIPSSVTLPTKVNYSYS